MASGRRIRKKTGRNSLFRSILCRVLVTTFFHFSFDGHCLEGVFPLPKSADLWPAKCMFLIYNPTLIASDLSFDVHALSFADSLRISLSLLLEPFLLMLSWSPLLITVYEYSGTSINGHLVKAVTYPNAARIAGHERPPYVHNISGE